MILTVRTTRGREKTVLDSLKTRMENAPLEIKAIFYPHMLKGYLFVEGEEQEVDELIKNIRHVRGLIRRDVAISELEKFLATEAEEIELEVGDIVEVIDGPFKDEVAKIKRVDKTNREVVIELLDAAVPIPVTIKTTMLRKRKE